jgi:hypothetical protein
MTDFDRPSIRVASHADLAALLPYLVGFHPQSSLLLLALRGSRVVATVRLDLPTRTDDRPRFEAGLDSAIAALTSRGITAAILAGYGTLEQVAPAVQAAAAKLHVACIPLLEAMRIAEGRYSSLTCTDPACCPPEGTPFDPTVSPAAAEATVAGLAALPNRDALAAGLAPLTGVARAAMRAATTAAAQVLLELIEQAMPDAAADPTRPLADTPVGSILVQAATNCLTRAHHCYQVGRQLGDEHAALMTVLLALDTIRDLAARRTTGEVWQLQLWTDLTRRADPDFATTPATLLALAAIQAGNGALADVALRRAMDADPDNRLAHLLAHALAAHVDPGTITAILADSD